MVFNKSNNQLQQAYRTLRIISVTFYIKVSRAHVRDDCSDIRVSMSGIRVSISGIRVSMSDVRVRHSHVRVSRSDLRVWHAGARVRNANASVSCYGVSVRTSRDSGRCLIHNHHVYTRRLNQIRICFEVVNGVTATASPVNRMGGCK